jgi:hypothetical protein
MVSTLEPDQPHRAPAAAVTSPGRGGRRQVDGGSTGTQAGGRPSKPIQPTMTRDPDAEGFPASLFREFVPEVASGQVQLKGVADSHDRSASPLRSHAP